MKIVRDKVLFLSFFILLVTACSKQDREVMIANEIKAIDNYAENQKSSAVDVVVNAGATRIVKREGTGNGAVSGDSLYIKYGGYTFNNGPSSLFDTNLDSLSSKLGIEILERGFDLGKCKLAEGQLIKGLELGLTGVKEGEYCYVVFPSNLGFGKSGTGIVPKMTPLIYEVWVTKIKKQ
ncbi:MAG: FKBP-type peptidyl-prolyl cis-trans isomerase [Bacteroidales bacterium]|nr:FKBP-type peptidyl-prolyl cis-trans isomerase [Bacteroidales bacterium]MDD2424694.1 FKBP-type peptidyl-prolyl cis-trans isomerase [Bacteroidales bacterium]MDD3989858.1 FKBP-type peptidyl-prolyl cis-trans isomerase [Bacteroidales bacterium]MDD4639714.1 FKBP-type peptidyl-prolyl cis-trans isomerase [Bacteroidales bacterium]